MTKTFSEDKMEEERICVKWENNSVKFLKVNNHMGPSSKGE